MLRHDKGQKKKKKWNDKIHRNWRKELILSLRMYLEWLFKCLIEKEKEKEKEKKFILKEIQMFGNHSK